MNATNFIYIGQYEGVSFSSRLIKWFTWSKISHTSAVLYRKNEVIEAWGGGVVRRSISAGHKPGTVIHIYRIPCTVNQRNKFYNFMESQIGKRYDFLGILSYVTRTKLENKDKVVCSELVYTGLEHVGIKALQNIEAYQVSPGVLNLSPLLEFVETITL